MMGGVIVCHWIIMSVTQPAEMTKNQSWRPCCPIKACTNDCICFCMCYDFCSEIQPSGIFKGKLFLNKEALKKTKKPAHIDVSSWRTWATWLTSPGYRLMLQVVTLTKLVKKHSKGGSMSVGSTCTSIPVWGCLSVVIFINTETDWQCPLLLNWPDQHPSLTDMKLCSD